MGKSALMIKIGAEVKLIKSYGSYHPVGLIGHVAFLTPRNCHVRWINCRCTPEIHYPGTGEQIPWCSGFPLDRLSVWIEFTNNISSSGLNRWERICLLSK